MKQSIANNINILGQFCGKRDVEDLTKICLNKQYGISQVDVMVLFGGSILSGGDLLAQAIKEGVAKKYVIVGGRGHTTQTLEMKIQQLYPNIITGHLSEAELFSQYLNNKYGLTVDYLECQSTNCGNNITYLLNLLKLHNISFKSIIISQDATMQLRMEAGLRKYLTDDVLIINYATYKVKVVVENKQLTYQTSIDGMWEIDRYVNLLMGEIPRLSDNIDGYGPLGANYIIHIDIPEEVLSAYTELKKQYETRVANPKYASK